MPTPRWRVRLLRQRPTFIWCCILLWLPPLCTHWQGFTIPLTPPFGFCNAVILPIRNPSTTDLGVNTLGNFSSIKKNECITGGLSSNRRNMVIPIGPAAAPTGTQIPRELVLLPIKLPGRDEIADVTGQHQIRSELGAKGHVCSIQCLAR